MTQQQETWKDIPGFEGAYQVSDLGRVRSLDRVILVRGFPRRLRSRIVAPQRHSGGYRKLQLAGHQKFVHRLVAAAFLGPCPEGKEVAHLDNDRANNALSNLAYLTHQENLDHMLKHGTRWRGETHPMAVLTTDDVRQIRQLAAQGITQRAIAEHYPVTDRTIGAIVRKDRWSHV